MTNLNIQIKKISEDVRALPRAFRKVDVSELSTKAQSLAQTALGQATEVYTDLNRRGEAIVNKAKGIKADEVKTDAQKTATDFKGRAEKFADKAERLADDVADKADDFAEDVKGRAEELVADARKRSEELLAEVGS